MTGRIPRITNAQIEADTQTIRALKGIPDYKPHNPEYSAEAAEAALDRIVTGLTLGLATCGLAALWERLAFPGLTNFAADYRSSALFWEMHVGGAALDAWLALALPFALAAIARARAAGDRVILIRHEAEGGDGIFAPGSSGTAIRPGILAAAGNAPVVTKHFADSFQDTDLETHLAGIDSLLICGMMTQNCVVFTAMSELTGGRDIAVVGDLCAAPSQVVHLVALAALGSKRKMADAASLWP